MNQQHQTTRTSCATRKNQGSFKLPGPEPDACMRVSFHFGSGKEDPTEEQKGSLQRQGTFSKEQERENSHTAELIEKLESQNKRLLELEWELGCVRSDKEMLLSRSKCQEDELQELRATVTVTNKMMGVSLVDNDSTHTHTHTHHTHHTHHHWWAVDASEYEVGHA